MAEAAWEGLGSDEFQAQDSPGSGGLRSSKSCFTARVGLRPPWPQPCKAQCPPPKGSNSRSPSATRPRRGPRPTAAQAEKSLIRCHRL